MTEFSIQAFEESSRENGVRYWLAHEFMSSLGYETWSSFRGVITKAMGACAQLGLDPTEAFFKDECLVEGRSIETYRLTRFACFLVSMCADSRKAEVARAKAVLAAIADQLIQERITEQDLSRIEHREDLKAAEKMMSGAAQAAGLHSSKFAIFKDAGFRGMYNMGLKQLQRHKGAPGNKTLYDYMGLEELAGNLFRVTQTAARIKHKNVRGETALTETAKDVGSEVRSMMLKNSGVAPEALPLEDNIGNVKRRLKTTNKEMKRLDKKKP